MHDDVSTTVLGLHGQRGVLCLPLSFAYALTDCSSNANTNLISYVYSYHCESNPSSHSQSVAQPHPGSNDCNTHRPHPVV